MILIRILYDTEVFYGIRNVSVNIRECLGIRTYIVALMKNPDIILVYYMAAMINLP